MEIPEKYKELLDAVTNKRARYVIDTILEKGYCSTEDIINEGYEHAPRAARDVRELWIPLETYHIKDSKGKTIAAYRFGDWKEAEQINQLAKTAGRNQLSKKIKKALLDQYGARCTLYGEEYPARLLQADHRIPYEIGGDPDDMMDLDYFMLLSPSANRDKSWACEHCENWNIKDVSFCQTCYYAYPENYTHIAGKQERKLDMVFRGNDIEIYDKLVKQAELQNLPYQTVAKRIIEYYLRLNNE